MTKDDKNVASSEKKNVKVHAYARTIPLALAIGFVYGTSSAGIPHLVC